MFGVPPPPPPEHSSIGNVGIAILLHDIITWKTRHSKQVLVGLSVFSDGVLHFLQIKKKLYIFYGNYLVALIKSN